jgi:hypothetical protein
MPRKTIKTEFEVGDLIIYKPLSSVNKIQLGIVVKVKKLLNLYDVLIQTENIYLRNIPGNYLVKAV